MEVATLRHLRSWLNRVPIEDPVDHRNAFFMQVFLVFVGLTIPLNKMYLLKHLRPSMIRPMFGNVLPWPRLVLGLDVLGDVAITLSAWCGFYLIRKGHFRRAVILFLATILSATAIAYATEGYPEAANQPTIVMTLVVGGLMLGRRALWRIYATILIIFTVGIVTATLAHASVPHELDNAFAGLPSSAFSYLLLVLVLDCSIYALHTSLAEANARQKLLEYEMAERERTHEQLLHSQKMDAVGHLASGIAHDFNNVLGLILSFTTERHRVDPSERSDPEIRILVDALAGIEMAGRRGAAVSQKLLNFSRREVTHVETFDAVAALQEVRPLLRQLLPPNVLLTIDSPQAPLPICFDRSQWELALLNLASNARDAIRGDGELHVSITQDGPTNVLLSLRDTGVGMSEAVKQHIFEPFYTTKPPGSGTGLGLAVIDALVDRAGGSIEVESEPGAGTTLHIRLPLAHRVTSTESSSDIRSEAIRVLLIEDDDDLRGVLTAALQKGGCIVGSAATGAEVERIIRIAMPSPQVLVCDNHLPDTVGAILLRGLRQRFPDVPAILISAYLDTDGQPPGSEDSFIERLPKPFAPDTLVMRVQQAARRHAKPEALLL
jgi:signal transduction histidine kinase/ActR/RegA family two-component response regulator